MKYKIVVTDGMHHDGQEEFKLSANVELDMHDSVSAADLKSVLNDADFVVIRSATEMTAEVISALPKLKGILRAGVGTDNVDFEAANKAGVWVWNAPTGNFQATAELALGHIFACARQIPRATAAARKGEWVKKNIKGRQLSGSTLGIFGAGNIGLRVARMAEGLGMKVQICDPVFEKSEDKPYDSVSFTKLLESSDFITIHAPILDSTKHVFNTAAFEKMKKDAFIVNAARGGIVKDADLLAALNAGEIAGAGLDVYEKEPFDLDDPLYQQLLSHELLISTPHIGASTIESQQLVGLESAEKILHVIASQLRSSEFAPLALNRPENPRLNLKFSS